MIVCLAPWTIRNAIVMDAFVPVATNASATLWSGHHAGATGGQTYPPESYYQQFDQEPPLRELQSGKALRNDAIAYMLTHPLHELQLIPLKLIHLNRGDSYALDWVNDAPRAAPITPINVERIGVLADAGYYGLLALFLLGAVYLGRAFWLDPHRTGLPGIVPDRSVPVRVPLLRQLSVPIAVRAADGAGRGGVRHEDSGRRGPGELRRDVSGA